MFLYLEFCLGILTGLIGFVLYQKFFQNVSSGELMENFLSKKRKHLEEKLYVESSDTETSEDKRISSIENYKRELEDEEETSEEDEDIEELIRKVRNKRRRKKSSHSSSATPKQPSSSESIESIEPIIHCMTNLFSSTMSGERKEDMDALNQNAEILDKMMSGVFDKIKNDKNIGKKLEEFENFMKGDTMKQINEMMQNFGIHIEHVEDEKTKEDEKEEWKKDSGLMNEAINKYTQEKAKEYREKEEEQEKQKKEKEN
jgi:hypothetical protein